MSERTKWKLIWHGTETYPFPLSIVTDDDNYWIARDGVVSSEGAARLIASAPELLEALERLLPTEWSGLSDEGQPHNRTLLHSIDAIEAGYAAISRARGTA